LKLLYTVSKALRESCRASSDFAEISSFLTTLQTTLQFLQSLDTISFNPESKKSIAEQCQQIQRHVDVFLKDTLKYEPALKSAKKNSKILTAPRKIQWAFVMPSKVKKLREKIRGPIVTVNTLLGLQTLLVESQTLSRPFWR